MHESEEGVGDERVEGNALQHVMSSASFQPANERELKSIIIVPFLKKLF